MLMLLMVMSSVDGGEDNVKRSVRCDNQLSGFGVMSGSVRMISRRCQQGVLGMVEVPTYDHTIGTKVPSIP